MIGLGRHFPVPTRGVFCGEPCHLGKSRKWDVFGYICDNQYYKIFMEIREALLARFVPRDLDAPPTIDNHLHGDLLPHGTPISSIEDLSCELSSDISGLGY